MRDFFGCYLLISRNEKSKGRTYIGFTVNPRRRIRQHNGEICSGAWKTKRMRPWEMVLVVYGFPTQVQALQFEWAWQHPEKSLIVRQVRLVMEMLNLEPWSMFPLKLQLLSSAFNSLRAGCPELPAHMQFLIAPMEALPVTVDDDEDGAEPED
eukprot:jgi/Botrbrau1/2447/Bobra.0226s0006.1